MTESVLEDIVLSI